MPAWVDGLQVWVDAVTVGQAMTEARLKTLEAAVQAIRGADQLQDSLLTALTARVAALEAAPVPPVPPVVAYGPRVEIGSSVAPTDADRTLIATALRPSSFTAASLKSVLATAAGKVVYLPGGTYLIDQALNVPAGCTIIGEAGKTVLKATSDQVEAFFVQGAKVRFSRLNFQGTLAAWSTSARLRAIQNLGAADMQVDHCDITGWNFGVYLNGSTVSGRIEASRISKALVFEQGYGISVAAGAWALVTDCELADCRHCLTSGGGGSRPTDWEFLHCRITGDRLVPADATQAVLDAHGGMTGFLVVDGCEILDCRKTSSFGDGQGLITNNKLSGVEDGWKVAAFASGGVQGAPHDYVLAGNVFERVTTPYKPWSARNCYVDGRPVPETLDGAWRPPPRIPRLTVDSSGSMKLT